MFRDAALLLLIKCHVHSPINQSINQSIFAQALGTCIWSVQVVLLMAIPDQTC